MDTKEAAHLLQEHLDGYRHRSHAELVGLIGEPQLAEVHDTAGNRYQIEVVVYWDGRPGAAVRVIGMIDDGGWRAFSPLSDDFIVEPN